MSSSALAPNATVVVVGAGHAGGTLVGLLRRSGHTGPIVMIGAESSLPYQRPPLSKNFGAGDLEDWLRHPDFYTEQNIELRLNERATCLDTKSKQVVTDVGGTLAYDALVLATGARPRPLAVPGAQLGGVGALRTLDDARTLRKWLHEDRRILVVGGGYVGLEVAAVVRSHGAEVTVLEREDRVLARVASPEFARIITDHHLSRGTRIITDVDVVGFEGDDATGNVSGALLADGSRHGCDAIVVGVGAIPNDELAREAGLACSPTGGILVNRECRTSDPSVLAIGDATVRSVPGSEEPRRLESIPSATEQARQALSALLGTDPPAPETPWFWSDQFDLKLKIAGVLRPGAETVVRGDAVSGKFSLFHHVAGRVVAVESSNAAPEFMAGKKWIGDATKIDPDRLADASVSLRDVVA